MVALIKTKINRKIAMKYGDDYYMVHSSFDYYPGLLIWHSKDIVNWKPVTPALYKYIGSVCAPDITKHKGKYYIYFPARLGNYKSNYVVTADDIKGPWSDPVDLETVLIDPGHAAGPDGQQYILLSWGRAAPVSDDFSTNKIGMQWRFFKEYDTNRFQYSNGNLIINGKGNTPKDCSPLAFICGDHAYQVEAEFELVGDAIGSFLFYAKDTQILEIII